MLEETPLLYTFYGMNVCAESHLSECRNGQTDGSDRRSIALRAASGMNRSWGLRSTSFQSDREPFIASLRGFNATASELSSRKYNS
jgi:hypothetical protein